MLGVKKMDNEKKVVRVKLVKHEWPDERRARHKRYLKVILSIVLIICVFTGGVFVGINMMGTSSSSTVTNSKLNAIYRIMSEKWYFGKDIENINNTLLDDAIYGMTSQESDIHTQYLDAEYASQFLTSMEGSLVGIGVQYSTATDDYIILRVFEDSPAEKAGIQVGDIIRSVNGDKVEDIEDIASVVKGKEGTHVIMGIQRGSELLAIDCTRGAVNTSANGYIVDNVGVLEILSIAENTADVVGNILNDFKENNVKDIIIDLRGNGGGYLTTIVDIGSYFLPAGSTVLMEESKDGTRLEYKTTKSIEQHTFNKIEILIDGNTASAAEVLTIAMSELLDYVVVIGDQSYGKGTIQTTLPFTDGSMIKYTKAIWLSPKGNSINGVGITPDILVETPKALLTGTPVDFGSVGVDTVSEACQALQIYLEFLGYNVDRTDGYFSNETLKALQAFEKDYGLEVTNVLDEHVLTVVLSKVIYSYYIIDSFDVQMIKAFEEIK